MQNMLKHSEAKNAFLQIIIQQKLVSIYVEDDGIGMIANTENTGVGLKSIETLIQVLKGNCRIESNEKDGFSISIEFNQYENESI
jgi:signal transduction histidine kinase